MSSTRFETLKEIFHSARELQPHERSRFLGETCGANAQLRQEVEALLESHAHADDFIADPPAELAAQLLADREVASSVGRTIGHYKLLERIGAGGMGEVYLADDIWSGRKAALKLLQARFAGDEHRYERFQREARAVIALNHPNILTVYEIGQEDSTHYIVSELIEGETLGEGLKRGPLSINDAVDLAMQVASALGAAHKAGIVHRDIKPENIMVRADGYAKVLDFGIAKLTEEELPVSSANNQASAFLQTAFGSTMGTLRYMSPEQVRGEPADERSDIWSLGVVLYEMLSGSPPFHGTTRGEITNSILAKEPAAMIGLGAAAGDLQRIVGNALQKDAASRYAHVIELLVALKAFRRRFDAATDPVASERAAGARGGAAPRKKLSLAFAAAAIALIVAAAFWFDRASPEPRRSDTSNAAAREAFLKGRHFWNKRTGREFENARIYFERAIALDPQYAEAYAGLADTYQFIANGDRQIRAEYYAKAKQMIHRALELDPQLAAPHASLGLMAMNWEWDWPTAEREFKRSLELDPNYATAHHWYAFYLNAQARFDEAIKHIERARQLDPLSSIINVDVGQLLLYAGRLPEAEERLKETVRLDPGFIQARDQLGWVYIFSGRYDEALAEFEAIERENTGPSADAAKTVIGYIFALQGKQRAAEEELAKAQARFAADPRLDRVHVLFICLGLGRIDEAFEALEDEYRWRATTLTSFKVAPHYARLRSDPRYADLLRRLRLAQ